MKELPKKISPDPIISTTIEIRFEPLIDKNAVFGVFYLPLKDIFPDKVQTIMSTDIGQSTEIAPQPQYRISNEFFMVNIGATNMSIHLKENTVYLGWQKYSEMALLVFEKVWATNVIKKIDRLGIRYISFFEENIFKHSTLAIKHPSKTIDNFPMVFRFNTNEEDSYVNTIQLASEVAVRHKNENKRGSIIDIDTSINNAFISNFFDNPKFFLDRGHEIMKQSFFDLLTDDFISNLNPEY